MLTLVGEDAPRAVAVEAVARLDLRTHVGAHPRFGVVDVVPFVPLAGDAMADAVRARDEFARWASVTLDLPCFLYGPERTLPSVRKDAFGKLVPDFGPPVPRFPTRRRERWPSALARCSSPTTCGSNATVDEAKAIARALRGPRCARSPSTSPSGVQVSCNLVEPDAFGPAAAYDVVAAQARVVRAELVGLVPESVLRAVPAHRWRDLDLDADRTIEARLAQR